MGRTRANSQGLQLRRFKADMEENLFSRRIVQYWYRYLHRGDISTLGGCQGSVDRTMADLVHCWVQQFSEWDTGLDDSNDPLPTNTAAITG